MILIAESGSSKTDWIGYTPQKMYTFQTVGMNPYFYSADEVGKIMQDAPEVKEIANMVKEVYFFGSGCYSIDKHEVITNGLSMVFPKAFIAVESDVNAAAYSSCGNHPGFCCILGTGSNITYYDGESVFAGKHGLGYILGDEGSGTFFGKKILFDVLNQHIPPILEEKFYTKYPEMSKEFVLKKLYNTPHPNKFLASFSPFIYENIKHPYMVQTLIDGFQTFVDTNIKSYENYKDITCNFVGSIAWVYKDILKKVCEKNEIQVGNIIQKPIDNLVQYILKREGYIH